MSNKALRRQMDRIEQQAATIEQKLSAYSEDCICFPQADPPIFLFGEEHFFAFRVKCPLHGERFKAGPLRLWAIWCYDQVPKFRRRKSAQHRKAWNKSFPCPSPDDQSPEAEFLRSYRQLFLVTDNVNDPGPYKVRFEALSTLDRLFGWGQRT
jgi:hypothetical protein